jgi:hypothetical protein
MTDTDMLHMSALEARLTEAEKMLDRADALLNHAILVDNNDVKLADELQRSIQRFFRGEITHGYKIQS